MSDPRPTFDPTELPTYRVTAIKGSTSKDGKPMRMITFKNLSSEGQASARTWVVDGYGNSKRWYKLKVGDVIQNVKMKRKGMIDADSVFTRVIE